MSIFPRTGMKALMQGADNVPVANSAFQKIDYLIVPAVKARQSSPPGSPTTGDTYVVKPTGTGEWAGKDNYLAYWTGTQWTYTAPKDGFRLACIDEKNVLVYSVSAWHAYVGEALFAARKSSGNEQTLSGTVGVATAIQWNVLQVSLTGASVFTHPGGSPTSSSEIQVNETGEYEIDLDVGIDTTTSTAAVTLLEAFLESGPSGSFTELTSSNSYAVHHPTNEAKCTIRVGGVWSLTAGHSLRAGVRRNSGTSNTIRVIHHTRISVRRVR